MPMLGLFMLMWEWWWLQHAAFAASFTRAGTFAAVWEVARRTATDPCFMPAVLCADKKGV